VHTGFQINTVNSLGPLVYGCEIDLRDPCDRGPPVEELAPPSLRIVRSDPVTTLRDE